MSRCCPYVSHHLSFPGDNFSFFPPKMTRPHPCAEGRVMPGIVMLLFLKIFFVFLAVIHLVWFRNPGKDSKLSPRQWNVLALKPVFSLSFAFVWLPRKHNLWDIESSELCLLHTTVLCPQSILPETRLLNVGRQTSVVEDWHLFTCVLARIKGF